METFTDIFNTLSASGAIVFLIAALFLLIARVQKKENIVSNAIRKNTFRSVFIVALFAMIGSLIYSNVIGFPPCDLCWYQRIFMYPIVFIAGFGLIKKDLNALRYVRILSVVGILFALYHTFIYYTGVSPLPCSADASCTARYVFEFGFVTIPLMSLSVFAVILLSVFGNPQKDSSTAVVQ